MCRHVVWNGVGYYSVREAAQANGIKTSAMCNRLAKGYTCDNDMPGTGSVQRRKKPVTWNGVTYPCIADAAEACYITVNAMYRRLRKGYTCDDDLAY